MCPPAVLLRCAQTSATAALLVCAMLWPALPQAQDAPARGRVQTQSAEQAGVDVAMHYSSAALGIGQLRLQFSAAADGQAARGLRPAAWLMLRRSELLAAEQRCSDRLAPDSRGLAASAADIDLNGWRLLTLNDDATLAVLNPYRALRNSRLEGIVVLPTPGHALALSASQQRAYVSLPDSDAFAVVALPTRTLHVLRPTGSGSRPQALLTDDAARQLWVSLPGARAIAVFDGEDAQPLAQIALDAAPTHLALAADTPWLFVGHSDAGRVEVIDRLQRQRLAGHAVAAPIRALAWSASAQRLVVLAGSRLRLIDPAGKSPAVDLALPAPGDALALFDQGRYALVAHADRGALSLIDLARRLPVAHEPIGGQPTAIALTDAFAYVMRSDMPQVQVIALAQARQGHLRGTAIPMGRGAPGEQARPALMAPAPEGNGMLVGNPRDATIFRHVEGMMVPVGSFNNVRRAMRAVVVQDTSLRERAPGRFEAAVHIPRSGRYDLIVRNVQPPLTLCFPLELQAADQPTAPPTPKLQRLAVQPVGPDGAEIAFRILTPPAQTAARGEVRLLAVQRHGVWQRRVAAVKSASGVYLARLQGLPRAELVLLVQAPHLGLDFAQGRLGSLQWPLTDAPSESLAAQGEVAR